MLQHIDIIEAKAHLGELLEKAIRGDEIVITQDDKPVVKMLSLVPVTPASKQRRKAGSAEGLIDIADDFNAPFEDYGDTIP